MPSLSVLGKKGIIIVFKREGNSCSYGLCFLKDQTEFCIKLHTVFGL